MLYPKTDLVRNIIQNLSYYVNNFVSCAVLLHVFYRRDKHLLLLKKIQKIDEMLMLQNPKWRQRKLKIRYQLLKYVILIVIGCIIKFLIEPFYSNDYVFLYCNTLGTLFISISGYLNVIFYLNIFTTIFNSFDYFMKPQSFEERDIQNMVIIKSLYGEVYGVVRIFNIVFGWSLFTLITANFVNLVGNCYFCFNFYMRNWNNNLEVIASE